jgi:hypothetical protein
MSQENEPSVAATTAAMGRRQANEIQVDDSKLNSAYANFCRVLGTPEELIVDFGLNTQTPGGPPEPVVVNQRIVLNFFTAKRLLHALAMSVQRFEQTFGNLETDVAKRVVNQPK